MMPVGQIILELCEEKSSKLFESKIHQLYIVRIKPFVFQQPPESTSFQLLTIPLLWRIFVGVNDVSFGLLSMVERANLLSCKKLQQATHDFILMPSM